MASMSGSLLCLDEYCNAYGKNGLTYAMRVVKKNRELYKKYSNNIEVTLSDEQMKHMEVLETLENLGFPMDEVGTHYYKDVILSICDDINNEESNLVYELDNMHSNLYHMIARDEYDMGTKVFNAYINGAIERIARERADKDLMCSIFGMTYDDFPVFEYDDNKNKTFGREAYCIAMYLVGKVNEKVRRK